MALPRYSLNTLHAFAVAARQLNFTRAASELCVTQAAVSHQIKLLEQQIGRPLFLRTARGLQLTDEGERLAAPLQQAFVQIDKALQWLDEGAPAERLSVAVVGTFAHGWLLERLADFQARHPGIELRLQTHNNKIELASEAVDLAIRFGDGAWRSVQAEPLLAAPLSPLCSPALARQLGSPADLRRLPLLRSYRGEDWPAWSRAAGLEPLVARGPQFDASVLMVQAAMRDGGVALAPPAMFRRELAQGQLLQPFAIEVDVGRYWLTRALSRPPRPAMQAFRDWLRAALADPRPGSPPSGR